MTLQKILSNIGAGLDEMLKRYIANPNDVNRELIINFLQAMDAISNTMFANEQTTDYETEIKALKNELDSFLIRASKIVIANPSMKSFKYFDQLLRMLKKL